MEEARFWASSVEKIDQLVRIAAGQMGPGEFDPDKPEEIEVHSFAEFNRHLMS